MTIARFPVPPIVKRVTVRAAPARAFALLLNSCGYVRYTLFSCGDLGALVILRHGTQRSGVPDASGDIGMIIRRPGETEASAPAPMPRKTGLPVAGD